MSFSSLRIYICMLACCLTLGIQPLFAQCGTATITTRIRPNLRTECTCSLFTEQLLAGDLALGMKDIPVKIHIVRKSDRTGGIPFEKVEQAIENLNDAFRPAYLNFRIYDKPNYINNSDLYEFHKKQERTLERYDVPRVLNIYCFGRMTNGKYDLSGYTYLPPQRKDRVMMWNKSVSNGTSFIHEIGHYFGLFHTHGTSNRGTTDEFANGENCRDAGDYVCDTPADPNLSKVAEDCTKDCEYVGDTVDPQGNAYNPMVTNYMCYNPYKSCRREFTQGQYARIAYYSRGHRRYLRFPESVNPLSAAQEIIIKGNWNISKGDTACGVEVDMNMFAIKESYTDEDTCIGTLTMNTPKDIHIYTFHFNTENEAIELLPMFGDSVWVRKGKQTTGYPISEHLKHQEGKHFICSLYSKDALDIQNIYKKLEKAEGNFIQRLYKVLGKRLLINKYTHYSVWGKQLYFEGKLDDKSILPVIIQLTHS